MKQVTVTLGYRQQKCKATWSKRLHQWKVWCPEHEMWSWHVKGDAIVLPHDIAVRHAARYHKE